MRILYVILFIFSSFVLTECVEDVPSDYPPFREFLDQSLYINGSGSVTDLNGFQQWSFKRVLFRDEAFISVIANNQTPMSVLQETRIAGNFGSDGPASRVVSEDYEVIEDVEVHIPEQENQGVENFSFAYFVNVEPHEDVLPGTRVVALQWSRDQHGKQDWIFARFWKKLADPGDIELLPIGPRPGDPTKYSIRIKHDIVYIFVNDERVLSRTLSWLVGLRFIRCAGIALSELQSNTTEATLLLKNIRWDGTGGTVDATNSQ